MWHRNEFDSGRSIAFTFELMPLGKDWTFLSPEYGLVWLGLVWFGLVSFHINHCRLLIAESSWYTHTNILNTYDIEIRTAILFLFERYKIHLLSNKAVLCEFAIVYLWLVASDWIIYCFYFSHLSFANLPRRKLVNIYWQFIDGRHTQEIPPNNPAYDL